MPLDQIGTGTGTYSDERGFNNVREDRKTRFTKTDSKSAFDLRENTDFTPHSDHF